MNSHTGCELFDIKCEEDSMSAEPQNIKNEIKPEVFESNVFSGCIDIKNEIIPVSELVSSIETLSEVENSRESMDSAIQDDEKNVLNQNNNSEECKTNFVPILNESSTTYETDLEEEKCNHTRKEACTCVRENCIFKYNNLNMCTQIIGKDFNCKNGNKSYSYKSDFIKHKGDKLFSCNICSKSFANKKNLKRHLLSHIAEKRFICSNCNKSFRWKQHLEEHMRIHSGEKPFTCDVCSKSFARKSYLDVHIVYKHGGDKLFTCDKCNSTFRTRSDLKRHSHTHSDEKPFMCEICSRSFRTRYQVKRHSRTHAHEKFFTCQICSKSYSYTKNLIKHNIHVHSEKMSFTCNFCRKSFIAKEHLERHMLNDHHQPSSNIS